MRAKLPTQEGFVERDGVKLHYEIYGNGPQTMVFVPSWVIVHSRIYKAQLPYFSERFRCITYDGRGNGQSDRPEDVAAYSLDNYVADVLAVMDATDAGQAILVGLSYGGLLGSILAAHHPERVKAAILAGTVATGLVLAIVRAMRWRPADIAITPDQAPVAHSATCGPAR